MMDKCGDGRVYAWVAGVLRVGLLISFGLMAVGLIWAAVAGTLGEDAPSLGRVFPEATSNPAALTEVGILALIATPVATLLAVLAGYTLAGNRGLGGLAAVGGWVVLLTV